MVICYTLLKDPCLQDGCGADDYDDDDDDDDDNDGCGKTTYFCDAVVIPISLEKI